MGSQHAGGRPRDHLAVTFDEVGGGDGEREGSGISLGSTGGSPASLHGTVPLEPQLALHRLHRGNLPPPVLIQNELFSSS